MRPRLWLLLAVLIVPIGFFSPARAAGDKDNFVLDVPPDWNKIDGSSTWEKDKIVAGARRLLTKLDDGKPANGEAGQMHLSVTDAPAGKTVAEIAADPAQRELLLRLYAKPPEVTSEEIKVRNVDLTQEAPAVLLKAEGTAVSDASGNELPCVGLLLVAVVKEKLYRLRLFAWVTPDDAEQLRTDLDSIYVGFAFLDLAPKPGTKPPPGKDGKDGKEPPPTPGGPPEEPKPVGDSDEEKVLHNVVQGWKAKKPKKLATQEIDHAKREFTQIFLRGNDTFGSCDVMMDVYPNGMIQDGKKVPDQDIRKFLTTSFWQSVSASYPKGSLETFAWPKAKGGQFLLLPLLDAPRVLFEATDARPKVEDVDVDYVLKKLKFTEEVKNPAVGKTKCELAYRGVVKGNREREGYETAMRWAWRTEGYTFFLWVTIRKEGAKRYLEPVRQFLESLEVTK